MIITQTPLRVSLLGGGTDFREFFRQDAGGAVLSLGIDKYIYVIVKERFDDKIYINYSRKEIVDSIDEIQHELVREAMRKTGVFQGVEITTLADVPSEGSGLGSSSSVTVGLLNALYAFRGEQVPLERLAHEACQIEIDLLKKPIGMQDQYIAAFGNLRFFEFCKDGQIKVEAVPLAEEKKRRLVSNLLLFFTNRTRQASEVLSEQRQNIPRRLEELRQLRELAVSAKASLLKDSLDDIGRLLHRNWAVKKKLASSVSNPGIDAMSERALKAGAVGGKVAGAGAGGFLLLYCPRDKQDALRRALVDFRELPFMLSRDGSKVIFNMRTYESK